MVKDGLDARGIIAELLQGFDKIDYLTTTDLAFKCQCSKERIEDVLISLNEQPRTFCRTVRRVADTGKVKHLRCGAEGIPSLNRALSQCTQTRNRVIYPCPG